MKYAVRRVTGFDLVIYREGFSINRAVPHLVIALRGALEETPCCAEQSADVGPIVVDHQAASKKRCRVATISIGRAVDCSMALPFSAKSSGTTI